MASLGCSAQARSYRDKPRPPAMRPCLVNRFPPVTRYALSAWALHPVPFDLGEVRKLGVIDEPTRVGHRELIGQACRIALSNGASTDTPMLPTESSTPRRIGGAVHKGLPICVENSIRPPNFELLRPSVVIRRRPQRTYPSGSAI